jgi:carbon storage regulator
MLILTRRLGEKLVIGEDVFLSVMGIKGNQVRLGIHAPKEVSVHREEIFLKVQAGELDFIEHPQTGITH